MSAQAGLLTDRLDFTAASRIEDAGLNASAPPQQLWLDGWLARFSPGKAKRARCINAVAEGRLPFEERLALAEEAYVRAGLPLILRITPFTCPPRLDSQLQALGFGTLDDTRVMACPDLGQQPAQRWPDGLDLLHLSPEDYAETVGALRGSPESQRRAQAQRVRHSPVPYSGFALRRGGETLACGQFAREGSMVGLYDVFTAPEHRGQGLAAALCRALLGRAVEEGARSAYLQVEHDNEPARAIYRRLGFFDVYAYHYRTRDPAAK